MTSLPAWVYFSNICMVGIHVHIINPVYVANNCEPIKCMQYQKLVYMISAIKFQHHNFDY